MSNLLFCINSSYVDLFTLAIFSVKRSGRLGNSDIYVINADLGQAEWERIERLADQNTRFHNVSFDKTILKDAPTTARYPQEIYYRLFAPILLPDNIDRILYMDADVICINSLAELYDSDIEEYCFTGCTHTRKALTHINAIRLGLGAGSDSPYLNTGVLLMNLDALRKNFDAEKLFSFIEKKGRSLMLPDQDLLMALYGDSTRLVDYTRYNLSDRMLRLYNLNHPSKKLALSDVASSTSIIHYCGRYKPWKAGYRGQLGIFYRQALEEALKAGLGPFPSLDGH